MSERLETAAAAAGVLTGYLPALSRCFDTLRGRVVQVQTVHGDFHLGQTLLTPEGWRIIDFEGEPLKSFAERQAPDSVWRDVAGMTRSISYATSAHPDPASEEALNWLTLTREAFLGAYCGDQRQIDGSRSPGPRSSAVTRSLQRDPYRCHDGLRAGQQHDLVDRDRLRARRPGDGDRPAPAVVAGLQRREQMGDDALVVDQVTEVVTD